MKKVWAVLALLFLLLTGAFMDSVDFGGMDFLTGFLGAGASIAGFAFCLKKGGFMNEDK